MFFIIEKHKYYENYSKCNLFLINQTVIDIKTKLLQEYTSSKLIEVELNFNISFLTCLSESHL